LIFLERDDSDSLVLAATNLVEMLDSALFRRFDDVLNYALPTAAMRRDLIRNRLNLLAPNRIRWENVLPASEGLSHAEVARACNEAAKDAVLLDRTSVSTKSLVAALQRRMQLKGKAEEL
jgi:ATP-dependent 26S proteasome regulatory subunit